MGGFTAAVEPSNYEDNKQPKSKRETNSVLQRLLFFWYLCSNFALTPCSRGQCFYVPLKFTQENKHSEMFIGYLIAFLVYNGLNRLRPYMSRGDVHPGDCH
jgi:hypothetical protein